jgi:lipid-A-disaccharide synthase-like uncharacterized protein
MLVDLSRMIGTYLQDVFVNTLDWWVVVGLIAQFFFTARFVVQWLASERAGRSIIPVAFWFLSMAGGAMLLIYAIHRKDPVFIAGQAFGLFVYLRNVQMILKEFRRTPAHAAG